MPQAPASPTGIHPLVDALAERIRTWREGLSGLEPLPIDPDLEAISGRLDGEALFIHNEVHRCRGLRKLHLETARLGAGLQILHCVLFPDPRYDLPVFGADIVAGRGVVSAAIVDLSPVLDTLPPPVETALAVLTPPPFSQPRPLPDWGEIFSPHVLFVRPSTPQEEAWFIDSVVAYLRVLAAAANAAEPPSGYGATLAGSASLLQAAEEERQDAPGARKSIHAPVGGSLHRGFAV